MHSKHKGTIAETKVVADLYQKGISVAIVVDDLLPIDLIGIKNNKLYKIQVKYSKLKVNDSNKSSTVELSLRRCMSNKNLLYTKYYTSEEVDIFALYVPEIDQCFYIKSDILKTHKTSFILRDILPKNNQYKKVNLMKDYLDFPCGS